MTIYDDFQDIAGQLLAQPSAGGFGQGEVVYIAVTQVDDAGDPWEVDSESTVETTLSATVRGVPDMLVDGKDVVASDLLVTAAANVAITPKTGDRIRIDGTERRVGKVMPIPPAGTTVVWQIVVKT